MKSVNLPFIENTHQTVTIVPNGFPLRQLQGHEHLTYLALLELIDITHTDSAGYLLGFTIPVTLQGIAQMSCQSPKRVLRHISRLIACGLIESRNEVEIVSANEFRRYRITRWNAVTPQQLEYYLFGDDPPCEDERESPHA